MSYLDWNPNYFHVLNCLTLGARKWIKGAMEFGLPYGYTIVSTKSQHMAKHDLLLSILQRPLVEREGWLWLIVGHILVKKSCFTLRRVKLILCEMLVKNLWQGKISLVKGGRRSQSPYGRTILHCMSSELVSQHNLFALFLSLRKPHWGFLHWWSLLIHCGSLFTVTHL